ncbi:MAG: TetR/AcrR family transcriptional regulator [Lactobacillales bacterium]|jgi:AcrR family transcriptional regulator|nr:TetR/AcrR family transcriptional regulator [Lactobacillales bacterium]
MSRPSRNADKKMIQAGLKIMAKKGREGLTVREICRQANVNLGMFPYHFQTKDNFLNLLYTEIQNDMEKYIDFESVINEPTMVQLKYVFTKIGEFTLKNQKLAKIVLLDRLSNTKVFEKYIDKGILPRYDLPVSLVERAKKEGLLKKELTITEVFSMLLFGVIIPELFHTQMNDMVKLHHLDESEKMRHNFFYERIDIIFKVLEA